MTTAQIPPTPDLVVRSLQADWDLSRWEALAHDQGYRYEVIDGVLYVTTAPSFFHQWIIKRLERFVGIPAEDQGLAFTVAAPVGVIMPKCDPVQPDYVVVLKAKAGIIRNRRIYGVPDLLIEVLSPSNAVNDEKIKLEAYAQAGVPEYVLIRPVERTLSHYRLAGSGRYGEATVFVEQAQVAFDCLPTITFRVANLFAGAPDTTM